MNERIKELRLALGLNQSEFGARIGLRQTSIANYEKGLRQPLDTVITSICREFGVNEEWLRTGEGPQFIEITRAEQIQQMVDDIMRDHTESFRRRFVTALAALDSRGWDALEKFIDSISDQGDQKTERERLHEDLDRQLSEEECPADESEASHAG